MYLVINKWVIAVNVSDFSGQYLRNHWTLDIGVLGYIGIVWPKEHSPEVWSIPLVTPCIYLLNFVIKWVGIPLLSIIVHNLSLSTESKAFLKSINAMYVGLLNSLCFLVSCEAENMLSVQDLPFLNAFCSSNNRTSAINKSLCNNYWINLISSAY